MLLFVTPQETTPWEGYYSGCLAFEFTNLETASVRRSAGLPAIVSMLHGEPGSFHGACSYLESADRAGVMYDQLLLPAVDFGLRSSGKQP